MVESYNLYLIKEVKWPFCNMCFGCQHKILKIRWISTSYRKDNIL